MKRSISVLLILTLCLCLCACSSTTSKNVGEFKLPSYGIATLLPQPDSCVGEIISDSADSFWVDVYETSQEQYNSYVDACKEAGFFVDYSGSSFYYDAQNENGDSLSISYNEDEQLMSIAIDAATEETEPTTDGTTTPKETEPATEPKTEPETEPTTEPKEEPTTKPNDNLIDGLRPEFKKAMDEYEDFFEEYCSFMKKMNADPTNLTLLTEYASFLEQYEETMDALEEWENQDMNPAEEIYYLAVVNRINNMLLDAAQ